MTLEEAYRRGVEAFNRRDLAGWLSRTDAEIDVESRFSRVGATFYRGHGEIEQWWGDLAEAWEYLEVEPDVVRQVAPDQTLALIHLRAKGRESGVEVREPHAHRVDFRAGKWLRLRYEDRALAERELRAAG